ncbi:BA75_04508T0 [Komagataella pastoris]|uniref:Riboflavin kinase n=1 Tax=Komagataella pastoris TaxID=4922 RepID=A0A1B2JHR7_PICPA|nr:BA75_04508T0 [Komagataella pastoris]
MTRPVIPIPKTPSSPFPLLVKRAPIIAGFGRGSSAIGCPTANIPIEALSEADKLDTGVYFGWCKIHPVDTQKDVHQRQDGTQVEFKYGDGLRNGVDINTVLPMVMSLGWNPFFKNKEKAAEIHVIHKFPETFYGAELSFNILGYIRPELDYTSVESLIKDIGIDIEVAKDSLATEGYQSYKEQVNNVK